MTRDNQENSVVIIGAGLAGMAAAVDLADAGHQVTILEANRFIGGRTSSWTEQGMPIESGLHRFLGFYTALPALLKHVGIDLDKMLFWEDEIEVRSPDGAMATLGLAPLHKPFKTAWSIAGHNDFLTPADKLAVGKMFAAGMLAYEKEPDKLDQITVAEYAKQHDISDRAFNHLLIPITEGIFFLPIHKYSMFNLMGLFMPYLKSLPKLRVGAFQGGMSEVMMRPLAEYVQARGGRLVLGAPAQRILVEHGRVAGVIAEGTTYRAPHTILAASLHGAQKLVRASFDDTSAFATMLRLPTMPAVTFQIELTEPAMPMDRTTFGPQTALASFAEQSRTTFKNSAGRLSVILTPPENFLGMAPADILKIVIADAARLGIELDGKVKDFRKVELPHDFYALSPGSEALRPPQKTSIPGLALAGDYTKQPYLATMEGAVVSGTEAAKLVRGEQQK
jgi:15-cis-phytoene desaturase